MRNALDHIEDDIEAVTRAFGCLLARIEVRLARAPRRAVGSAIRRFAGCCVAGIAAASALAGSAAGQTAPSHAAFSEAACALPDISPDILPRLRCGTVAVPRAYDHPQAGQFRLAVVVVRSARQPARPDPVVYISGGPGGPLTIYTEYQARHPYAPDRDLILVDQRGMGRSEPTICPHAQGQLADAQFFFVQTPTDEEQARRHAVVMACRDEAIAQGLDLADFGTSVTVADVEQVRLALGIARWNLVGESYGTTVAMTLLAQHPATVRSAVLDSVYPPDDILPPWSVTDGRALDAFFAACESDAACSAKVPGLAALYRDTLDRLARHPLALDLPPRLRRPDRTPALTASLFEYIVARMVYYPTYYRALPRWIAAVHDGDAKAFGQALVSLVMSATTNPAALVAVQCRDRPTFHQALPPDARPLDKTNLFGLCNDWSALGPKPLIPRDTVVPTLVLVGQFDTASGPEISRQVADLIGPKARWVEFSLIGHSVRSFSPCAARIESAFIDDPAGTLDTSCASRHAPIDFLPRETAH